MSSKELTNISDLEDAVGSIDIDAVPSEVVQDDAVDLRYQVAQHNQFYEEVRLNLRIDRSKVDRVVKHLLEKIENNSIADDELMALVKAMEVLAKTNDSSVKLLDSKSRLISSAKNVKNTGTQVNISNNLQNILEE